MTITLQTTNINTAPTVYWCCGDQLTLRLGYDEDTNEFRLVSELDAAETNLADDQPYPKELRIDWKSSGYHEHARLTVELSSHELIAPNHSSEELTVERKSDAVVEITLNSDELSGQEVELYIGAARASEIEGTLAASQVSHSAGPKAPARLRSAGLEPPRMGGAKIIILPSRDGGSGGPLPGPAERVR